MNYSKILSFILLIIVIYLSTNKQLYVYGKIMKTSEELKHGLMFRKEKLNDNEGMLFKMKPNENNTVWMKNTYIPLDVIFLNDNMKIVGYKENTIPLSTESISINKPSSYILEMNSGSVSIHSINIGDTIYFISD